MRAVTMAVGVALLLGIASAGQAQQTPPSPPPVPPWLQITVCVVENGVLREIPIRYVDGDSLMEDGRRFVEVYPVDGRYAAVAPWYIDNEPIRFDRLSMTKYGLPRVLGINEVTPVGEYRGVTVFAEAGAAGPPDVIYIPVRTGCEFQPYQSSIKTGGVRG